MSVHGNEATVFSIRCQNKKCRNDDGACIDVRWGAFMDKEEKAVLDGKDTKIRFVKIEKEVSVTKILGLLENKKFKNDILP